MQVTAEQTDPCTLELDIAVDASHDQVFRVGVLADVVVAEL
jgi:hypothetical protein